MPVKIIPYEPKVDLVAISKPCIKDADGNVIDMTAEDLIAYCARVSNPTNQLNTGTSSRLLRYCAREKHWSVFEQADFTVRIETSLAVATQILRHKSGFAQQFSQRYAEAQEVYATELRLQDTKNRQNSTLPEDPHAFFDIEQEIVAGYEQQFALYDKMLAAGVARECARGVLPQNTKTVLNFKMNVRDWIFYLQVRTGNGTQKEHQQVAFKILDVFKENFPNVYEAVWAAE